ncbi:hypothetical protein FJ364_05660, partial [Candidatus Dependentiae bacterium]|nr:hypothetical protein [Candidatus Dependentiae bacterium]
MKLSKKITPILMIMTLASLCGDEIVTPTLLPTTTALPLSTTLIGANQQKHEALALQNVTTALEQALVKHDNQRYKTKKRNSPKKKNKEKKRQNELKPCIKNQVHAATTEFLRHAAFNRLVTIKTQKISLRDALLVLAKQIGINLLIDPDIKGVLPSLRAESMPASAIIQMILDAHNPSLSLIRIAEGWRVVLKNRAEILLNSLIQGERFIDR